MIKGYKFRELSKEAQARIINDNVEFWIACKDYDSKNKGNFEKAVDKALTKDFLKFYVGLYCLEEIIEDILLNNHNYNVWGDIIDDSEVKYYENIM